MDKYINGSLWNNGKETVMLQQLTGDLFCLLDVGGQAMTLVMDPVHAGKWQYSVEEMPERLEGWKPVSGPATTSFASTHVVSEEIKAPKKTATRKARR